MSTIWPVQEREMEMRRQALEEERRRREELEKRLQEETSRRQRLVEREVKLREKQRSQVMNDRAGLASSSTLVFKVIMS